MTSSRRKPSGRPTGQPIRLSLVLHSRPSVQPTEYPLCVRRPMPPPHANRHPHNVQTTNHCVCSCPFLSRRPRLRSCAGDARPARRLSRRDSAADIEREANCKGYGLRGGRRTGRRPQMGRAAEDSRGSVARSFLLGAAMLLVTLLSQRGCDGIMPVDRSP